MTARIDFEEEPRTALLSSQNKKKPYQGVTTLSLRKLLKRKKEVLRG
jgi:hypothetical protein